MGANARALAEREFGRDDARRSARSACSRRRRADRPLVLRRQHERARLPARLPRRDRADPPGGRGARAARARQRLRRRLGGGRRASGIRRRACSRSTAAPARRRTTPPCCGRRAAATACSSTRTRSCARARVRALVDALEADPGAAVAGAQLLDSDGRPVPCAWRLPDIPWALAAAVFAQDRVAVESTGAGVSEVGWVQSSAALVRRDAAEQVGWLDPDFFVYSDETDFCKRLRDAGWRILFVPERTRGPPQPAEHRRRGDGAPDRRVPPQPRPLFPKARAHRHAARMEGVLDMGVPRARGGGRRAAGTRRPPLPAPCPPGAVPGPRRGHRGTQPRPATAHLPITCPPAMEHADTAQLAAVGGALGAVLVLLPARPRHSAAPGARPRLPRASPSSRLALGARRRAARPAERRHRASPR